MPSAWSSEPKFNSEDGFFSVMSTGQLTIWILTLVLTITAGLLDWRSRRIPNWLTVPSFFVGIILHAILGGWRGALFALEGAVLALALLFVPVLMRAIGAGDWKLVGAVGSFMGPVMVLFVLLASFLVSGLIAVIHMVQMRRVKETFRNMLVLVRGIFAFGIKPNPRVSLDNPRSLKLPYGVAVAAATVICFCAARWMA
jgi:prepilin peptidase CpaA